MSDRTAAPRQAQQNLTADDQCATFAWCEAGVDHNPAEHWGWPDIPPVTATGRRYEFVTEDFGVLVPEVLVRLLGDTSWAPRYPAQVTVELTIHKPEQSTLAVVMTLEEADYLRRHLKQLLLDAAGANP